MAEGDLSLEDIEMEFLAVDPLPYSVTDKFLLGEKLKLHGIQVVYQELLKLNDLERKHNVLAGLASYLNQMRLIAPKQYQEAGKLMWNIDTIRILKEDLMNFTERIEERSAESCKEVQHLLILLQCVAANDEVAREFAKCGVFQLLTRLIQLVLFDDEFEKIRVIALSIIGILCQSEDDGIVNLAVESAVLETCQCEAIVNSTNQMSKRISLHILEPILKKAAMHAIYHLPGKSVVVRETEILGFLEGLAASLERDPSPPLLYRIMKCYGVICLYPGGVKAIKNRVMNMTYYQNNFQSLLKEYPCIRSVLGMVQSEIEK